MTAPDLAEVVVTSTAKVSTRPSIDRTFALDRSPRIGEETPVVERRQASTARSSAGAIDCAIAD